MIKVGEASPYKIPMFAQLLWGRRRGDSNLGCLEWFVFNEVSGKSSEVDMVTVCLRPKADMADVMNARVE